jgi:hypothetical protein
MALKRCSSGHFFDPDRFSACPYCGGGDAAAPTVPRAPASPRATPPVSGGEPPTEALRNRPEASPSDRTAASNSDPEDGVSPGIRGPEASARAGSNEDEGVTIGVAGQSRGFDPVVGWLVCVDGPDRGRDFRIRAERNFIGRSRDMDVALTEDRSVSRDRHAILSFDPRTNVFVLTPGEGRGLVYHNGTSVLTPVELKAHDTIELGESTLRFVPLCGDDFLWS